MRFFYYLIILFFLTNSLEAQNKAHVLGTPCRDCDYSQKNAPVTVQNGSATINTSYTVTACGLDFVEASVRLNKRVFGGMTVQTGVNQPATYSISGIPSCAVIEKAFLYTSISGNGAPVTATITNPLSATSNFSLSIIGNHIDKCWGFAGTYSYRADVTSIISGNGNYIISGIPTSTVNTMNDADGATLFIIYRDHTQNYTGSIVIADGCFVAQGGVATATIGGFNVCATPSLTSNFAMIGDLQQIANSNFQLNSNTSNYILPILGQNVWNFVVAGGSPATIGQTSAIYGSSNASDCFNLVMAGMYYRTNCNTCPIPTLSVSTVMSSSCTVGSATATPSGGLGPYSYTWSPTGGNTSVISGATTGTYTVTVKDASCSIGFATVTISASPTVAASNQTLCSGNTATLSASGATTYSWSTGATASQIVVSPTVSTIYTVTGANGLCTDTKTVSVTLNTSPVVSASTSNSFICAGQTVTLSATGAVSYTYNPGGITGNPIALSPSVSTTYTVLGNNGGPCTGSALITQIVSPCTGVDQLSVSDAGFSVYPNPGKGEFELTLPGAYENCFVEIYNSIGQLIKKQNVKEDLLKLDLIEQANGVYYLRIIIGGLQVQKMKIVKE